MRYWNFFYSVNSANRFLSEEFVSKLCDFIPKNCLILDVGCGDGIISKKISGAVSGSRVVCIDFSKEAIHISNKKGLNGIVSRAETLAIKPQSFDVIVSVSLLEHLSNPSVALGSFYDSLKQDGLLVFSVPNDAKNPISPDHINFFDMSSIKSLLQGKFKPLHICLFTVKKNPNTTARWIVVAAKKHPRDLSSEVKTLLSDYNTDYQRSRKKLILSLMPPVLKDKHILDFGCGRGFFSVLFAKKGAFVTGIDKSKQALEVAAYFTKKENIVSRNFLTVEGGGGEYSPSLL